MGNKKVIHFIGSATRKELNRTCYQLEDLAGQLDVESRLLLREAAQGNLRVYVRVPEDVHLYSINEDVLSAKTSSQMVDKHVRRVGRTIGNVQRVMPEEIDPIPMGTMEIEGLYLDLQVCKDIYRKGLCRLYMARNGLRFLSGIMDGMELVEPIKGHFAYRDRAGLDAHKWRIAAFSAGQEVTPNPLGEVSRPHGFEISVKEMFVTQSDLEDFLDQIDVDKFLADILDKGSVVERPDYFSSALNYILDVTQSDTLKESKGDIGFDPGEWIEKKLMSQEFSQLFKTLLNKGAIEQLTAVLLPAWDRERRRVSVSGYPDEIHWDIKIAIAASKIFWSHRDVVPEKAETHPRAPRIKKFFIDNKVDRKLAQVLTRIIRRDGASMGRGGKKIRG